MKNVILLLVDGLNGEYLGEKDYKPSPSPFLDSLKRKNSSFENVYASGPYTEAAMIPFMCGYPTLDKYSFIENLKYAPKTIFEAFEENGYDTYSVILKYAYYSSFERGVQTERIYSAPGFHFIWVGRFRFYAQLYFENKLPESKFKIMEDFMEEYFTANKTFLNKYIQKTKDTETIYRLSKVSIDEAKEKRDLLEKEEKVYNLNHRNYIIGILNKGTSHPIFKCDFTYNIAHTDEMKKSLSEMFLKYKDTIQKMRKIQRKGNQKHDGHYAKCVLNTGKTVLGKMGQLLKEGDFSRQKVGDVIASPLLEISIFDSFVIDKILTDKVNVAVLKNLPDAKTMFDDFLDWYDNEYTHEKPFFSYLHIDDVHVNPMPYSYTGDKEVLEKEFSYMKEYVDSLDGRYHGNITYDCAIHNVDKKIEELFKELENRNILEDTTFIITADHGFYYSYYCYRHDSIANMYKENYHIPFIWIDDKEPKKIDGYYQQYDIPYTIADEFDIKTDSSWCGENMFKNTGRDNVLSEFPGRGSPDLEWKEFYFGCFDASYKVCVKVHLKDTLSKKNIVEIYDEVRDVEERNNLAGTNKYDVDKVNALYERIEKRFRDLQEEYKDLLVD